VAQAKSLENEKAKFGGSHERENALGPIPPDGLELLDRKEFLFF